MKQLDPSVADRVPPGQTLTAKWPVLTYGRTPGFDPKRWNFRCFGLVEREMSWTWDEFQKLPRVTVRSDIHCVTRWSKLDTEWRGVSVDRVFAAAGLDEPPSPFVMAFCDGGYTTNLPVEDVLEGKAHVVWEYEGEPLPPQHGGPARLLVPHLYFWKSAKWVRGLRFMEDNDPGFWEVNGYHSYGDPWREQRYDGD
jgi:DMSO/TMAO reductase YedYZ molybdopterin-dependent catalytic subunit